MVAVLQVGVIVAGAFGPLEAPAIIPDGTQEYSLLMGKQISTKAAIQRSLVWTMTTTKMKKMTKMTKMSDEDNEDEDVRCQRGNILEQNHLLPVLSLINGIQNL
jgi:hypothetical protein